MSVQDYGIIVGIIAAIATVCRFIFVRYKAIQSKFRYKLMGNWTNEGAIGGQPETHYIFLNLNVDKEDGEIIGIIESRNLSTGEDIKLSVNGTIRWKSADLNFTKVNQGRVSNLGSANIRFDNTKIIDWKIINDYNNFFPKETQIWANNIIS